MEIEKGEKEIGRGKKGDRGNKDKEEGGYGIFMSAI